MDDLWDKVSPVFFMEGKTCGWPVNREASTIAVKSDNG